MGKVPAGKLNKRVRFERKVAAQDSWGQPIDTWVPVVTVWCHVKTISGTAFVNNEMQAGGTEVSRTTASIRIRKRNDIAHAMRAVVGSRIYDIRAVLPDEEDDEYLDVACAIGANEGG